jgi:hypothetical protein
VKDSETCLLVDCSPDRRAHVWGAGRTFDQLADLPGRSQRSFDIPPTTARGRCPLAFVRVRWTLSTSHGSVLAIGKGLSLSVLVKVPRAV